jgi:hypothetical protein
MRKGILLAWSLALAALVAACAHDAPQPEAPPDFSAIEDAVPPSPAPTAEIVVEDQPESVKGAYEQEKDKARADHAAAKEQCEQEEADVAACKERAQADYQARLTVMRSRYESDKRKARD